jgi:hypothetical protein
MKVPIFTVWFERGGSNEGGKFVVVVLTEAPSLTIR